MEAQENLQEMQVIVELITPERLKRLKEEKKSQGIKKSIDKMVAYHFSSLIRGISQDFNTDFPEIIPPQLKYKSKQEIAGKKQRRRESTESRASSIMQLEIPCVSGRRRNRFNGSFKNFYEANTEVDKLIKEGGKPTKSKIQNSSQSTSTLKKAKQSTTTKATKLQSPSSSSSDEGEKLTQSKNQKSSQPTALKKAKQSPSKLRSSSSSSSSSSSGSSSSSSSSGDEDEQITKPNSRICSRPMILSEASSDDDSVDRAKSFESTKRDITEKNESVTFGGKPKMSALKETLFGESSHLMKSKNREKVDESSDFAKPLPIRSSTSIAAVNKRPINRVFARKSTSSTAEMIPNVVAAKANNSVNIATTSQQSKVEAKVRVVTKNREEPMQKSTSENKSTCDVSLPRLSLGPLLSLPPIPKLSSKPNTSKSSTSNGAVKAKPVKPILVEPPMTDPMLRKRTNPMKMTAAKSNGDDLSHLGGIFAIDNGWDKPKGVEKKVEEVEKSRDEIEFERAKLQKVMKEQKTALSNYDIEDLLEESHDVFVGFNMEEDYNSMDESFERHEVNNQSLDVCKETLKESENPSIIKALKDQLSKSPEKKHQTFVDIEVEGKSVNSIDELTEKEKAAENMIALNEKISEKLEAKDESIVSNATIAEIVDKPKVIKIANELDEFKSPEKMEESIENVEIDEVMAGEKDSSQASEMDNNNVSKTDNGDDMAVESDENSSNHDQNDFEQSNKEKDSDDEKSDESTTDIKNRYLNSDYEDILEIEAYEKLDYEYDEPSPKRKENQKQTFVNETDETETSYTTELDDLKLTITKEKVSLILETDAIREFDENSNKISMKSKELESERNIMRMFPNVCKFFLFSQSCVGKCTIKQHKLPDNEEMRIKFDYKSRMEIIETFKLMSSSVVLFKHYLQFMLETFVRKNMLSEVEVMIHTTLNFQYIPNYYHVIKDALMQHKGMDENDAIGYIIKHHSPTDVISESAIADIIFDSKSQALLHHLDYYQDMANQKNIPFRILIRMMKVFGIVKDPQLGYFILNQLLLLDSKHNQDLMRHPDIHNFIQYHAYLTATNSDREQKMRAFMSKYGPQISMSSRGNGM